ncbi:MAG: hypothetical protein LBS75_01925 [Synergistaceae bacterium]|nr:hypothetical protein [Synergistaceae bacterium]
MYYIRERREKRTRERERQIQTQTKAGGGHRFTFFSLMAIALFLAVLKAVNPKMPLGPVLIPFGCVLLACLTMIFLARRGK